MVKNTCSGIAILETAAFCFLLFALICSGLTLWEYINLQAMLRDTAAKHLNDSHVKPFVLNSQISLTNWLQIDYPDIDSALQRAVSGAKRDLLARNSFLRAHPNSFFLQSCYGVVRIETASGRCGGIENLFCPASTGNPTILTKDMAANSLQQKILSTAYDRLSQHSERCLVAVPNGARSNTFLPYSVVIAMRAYASLTPSPASLATFFFKHPAYIYHDQILTLRGDV